jgi:hypothetical protein
MSALGQKQTCAPQTVMSAFFPESGRRPLTKDVHVAVGHQFIRSPRRLPISVLGMLMPSLAVAGLMNSSTFEDCWTGRSAGSALESGRYECRRNGRYNCLRS